MLRTFAKALVVMTRNHKRVLANEADKDELDAAARRIQDEIYDNRIKSPLIPDKFYWLYRPKEESLMTKTADKLVTEFNQLKGKPNNELNELHD